MKKKRRALKRKPRNLVREDGLPWYSIAGQAWGTYDVIAEYRGCSRSSVPAFICKNNIRTVKRGRYSLGLKADVDRATGAAREAPTPASERTRRARR